MREARRPGACVYPIRMRHILNRGVAMALSGSIAIQRLWMSLPVLKAQVGRRWTSERKLIIGYVIAIAIVVVEVFVVYHALAVSAAGTQGALNISKVIGLNEILTHEVQDAVIAQREFLLLGTEQPLRWYTRQVTAFQQTADDLHNLVVGDPEQLGRLKTITHLFEKWRTEEAEPEIAARRLAPDHLFEVTGAAHAIALQLRRENEAIVGNYSARTTQWAETVDALKAQISVGLALAQAPAAINVWKRNWI